MKELDTSGFNCPIPIIKAKKEGVSMDDVEVQIGTMCNIVKNKYKGFLAGQVFEYAGFVSNEGSVGDFGVEGNHIAIITYWTTFDEHERSHADEDFKNAFWELLEFCEDTKELGYKLMWQGEQELDNLDKTKNIGITKKPSPYIPAKQDFMGQVILSLVRNTDFYISTIRYSIEDIVQFRV